MYKYEEVVINKTSFRKFSNKIRMGSPKKAIGLGQLTLCVEINAVVNK